MAVEEVNLLFTSRGGKETLDFHRTYTRVYEVITDDPEDDEQVVANAEGIPLLGDPLGRDPQAVASSIDVEQHDDSPLIWYVTVEYDSDPPGSERDRPDSKVDFDGNPVENAERAGAGDRTASPLDEPAVWTLTFEDAEEPAIEGIKVDAAGNLVSTAPGQWFGSVEYTRGTYVQNGGNVYVQIAGGIGVSGTGGGPAGTGSGIADSPDAWAGSTAYGAGAYVANGGNVYKCKTAGTSAAAGGPTSTSGDEADGTAVWNFVGLPAVWNFYATMRQVTNDPNYAIRVAILNSGGLPFDPPATTTVSRVVLSVTKNMPIATLEYLLALKNAVNLYPWRGVPPRCAKVKNVTHDGGKQQGGVAYVTTKWEIALDPDTWDLRLLDQGYGYIARRTDPKTGQPKPVFMRFVDANGESLDQPVPLDGAGKPLEPNAAPVFLRFVPRQTRLIDFNLVLPF
jgi:hypothetical protein